MTHLFGKLLIKKIKKKERMYSLFSFLSFPSEILILIKAKDKVESFLTGEFIFFLNFLLMSPQVT